MTPGEIWLEGARRLAEFAAGTDGPALLTLADILPAISAPGAAETIGALVAPSPPSPASIIGDIGPAGPAGDTGAPGDVGPVGPPGPGISPDELAALKASIFQLQQLVLVGDVVRAHEVQHA